jgi:hypothetical protein
MVDRNSERIKSQSGISSLEILNGYKPVIQEFRIDEMSSSHPAKLHSFGFFISVNILLFKGLQAF